MPVLILQVATLKTMKPAGEVQVTLGIGSIKKLFCERNSNTVRGAPVQCAQATVKFKPYFTYHYRSAHLMTV